MKILALFITVLLLGLVGIYIDNMENTENWKFNCEYIRKLNEKSRKKRG